MWYTRLPLAILTGRTLGNEEVTLWQIELIDAKVRSLKGAIHSKTDPCSWQARAAQHKTAFRSKAHAKCGRHRMAPFQPRRMRKHRRRTRHDLRNCTRSCCRRTSAGTQCQATMHCPPWPSHGMLRHARTYDRRLRLRLNSCRVGSRRRRPLSLAACARCGRPAASLHSGPHCVRAGIELRLRRARCAPRPA